MGVHSNNRSTGKGPYRYQSAKWKASVAVNTGDLVYRAADGYDKPASSFAWNTDLATTLAALRPLMRGVSDVRRTTLQTADGDQGTDGGIIASGEFTFPCAALGSAAVPGDYVTLAKQSGNAIEAAKVAITATAAHAIGKVTRDAAVGATELTFELSVPTLQAAIV
jgi:hypothetical protein